MPNKPYDFHDERRKTPSIEATKKAIELVQDGHACERIADVLVNEL